jgi:hypothetical protein
MVSRYSLPFHPNRALEYIPEFAIHLNVNTDVDFRVVHGLNSSKVWVLLSSLCMLTGPCGILNRKVLADWSHRSYSDHREGGGEKKLNPGSI